MEHFKPGLNMATQSYIIQRIEKNNIQAFQIFKYIFLIFNRKYPQNVVKRAPKNFSFYEQLQ